MASMEKRNFSNPEEVREFEKGRLEFVSLGGVRFGRLTLQPGWNWTESIRPIVKTDSCQSSHLQYHISGRVRIRMDDGTEQEFGPGDVSMIPPGHLASVVGDEPVVVIDVTGLPEYAVRK